MQWEHKADIFLDKTIFDEMLLYLFFFLMQCPPSVNFIRSSVEEHNGEYVMSQARALFLYPDTKIKIPLNCSSSWYTICCMLVVLLFCFHVMLQPIFFIL